MATLVITMVLDPQRDDAVVRTVRDEVLPWVRRMPGFVSGRWLRSEDRGCCLIVLEFDSVDAARSVADLAVHEEQQPARAWNLTKVVLTEEIAATTRPPAIGHPS